MQSDAHDDLLAIDGCFARPLMSSEYGCRRRASGLLTDGRQSFSLLLERNDHFAFGREPAFRNLIPYQYPQLKDLHELGRLS